MNVTTVRIFRRASLALVATILSFGCHADADEASVHRAALPDDIRPLLAMIIDTSAATARSIEVDEAYDAGRDYGAALGDAVRCAAARVYWRRSAGPAPDCHAQTGLEMAPSRPAIGLHCEAARAPLEVHGIFIASRAAQWHADGAYWSALKSGNAEAVECRADRGRHGTTAGIWYASDGPGGPWQGDVAREIAWDRSPHADPYIFYTGNYLNYLRAMPLPVKRPIAEASLRSLSAALASTAELEVALIRIDPDGPDGGYVASAPVAGPIAATELFAIAGEAPSGSAPLAETLTEAAAWLSGGIIRFGNDTRRDPAAVDSGAPGRYRSPFSHACRPVSLGYLTAAAASDDDLVASAAGALPRFDALTGGCSANCLAALEQWIATADLSDSLAGAQHALMTWISPDGLSAGVSGATGLLGDPLAFINLVARSFQRDAAVAADPQLSAAGLTPFAGDSGEPGIVLGLTAPLPRERWPGNLFRYSLRAPASPLAPPTVVDRDGEELIDPASGLPRPDSRSFWSDAPDGNLLTGGAAGRLPAVDARRIHSDIASPRILDLSNRITSGNAHFDRAIIGLAASDPVSLTDILDWPAAQQTLGDPGPHSPVVVDYPTADRQIVFAATHDGLLHAFDADSGVELWAWLPKELLPRLPELLRDEPTTVREHGIDGPLVLHRHDPDRNGRIDAGAGEHLWLLFGLGRGGNRYYTLDISAPGDPRLLWSAGLPAENAEARADPVVTRLRVEGSGQSAGDWVVLIGGGYDRRFDSLQPSGPGAGNALLILDAATGRLLWSAGDGNEDDLRLSGLASLPSAPRALDLDGDTYLDRAYLVDVTGELWRLNFTNGRSATDLADARLIARLGTGMQRFHATPDVSIARIGVDNRIAIAVGSGWLARPRDLSVIDRIYTIFDLENSGSTGALAESDLHDVTAIGSAMPATAAGWYARIEAHGHGEKIVGPTVTFDHALRFQTYQPVPSPDSEPCGPPQAMLRRYALDVRSGLPHASAVESEEDDAEEIAGSGLPVDLRFGFPDRWDETCTGCRPRPFGIAGGETFDTGYAGDPVKTSWRKLSPPPASP